MLVLERPLKSTSSTCLSQIPVVASLRTAPFNARTCDLIEYAALAGLLESFMAPIADIQKDLFGSRSFQNLAEDTLTWSDSSPRSFDGTYRRTWLFWMIYDTGFYLLPVGFATYIDHSGSDPSKWYLIRLVYHNQTFNDIDSFRKAWSQKTLKVDKIPADYDLSWASRQRKVNERQFDNIQAPESTSSSAQTRFRVDATEKYVGKFYSKLFRMDGLPVFLGDDSRYRCQFVEHKVQKHKGSS